MYNYLFAKQHGGDFIVRIEDTDQSRFVKGAEQYIFDCLRWAGLEPDESPIHGGKYGPYRQSERKEKYREYAEKLVSAGQAYYAFDTPEELEKMREQLRSPNNPSPQYDHTVREQMKNSLTIEKTQVDEILKMGIPHVIRIKMPVNEIVSFTDMIRGEVSFETSLVDDKVLLKADGMPTYHLAVVVDDHLMEITHAFRGEEWLPSAPVHILIWKYLFGIDKMPRWAHFPLILGPNGKLSKRDGAKFGFPVFAMNWADPNTHELTEGFREKGFLPEAFINLLALLGWNDGTEQEIFTKEELVSRFSMERVHSGGARFDYEKAKWFNHEWIKKLPADRLVPLVRTVLEEKNIQVTDPVMLGRLVALTKERCTLLTDFYEQCLVFFKQPEQYDVMAVRPRWNEDKRNFFIDYCAILQKSATWEAGILENSFKELATKKNIKPGELQLPLRIMLVGGKFGPPVFQIAELLGTSETIERIRKAIPHFESGD